MKAIRMAKTAHQNVWAKAVATGSATAGGSFTVDRDDGRAAGGLDAGGGRLLSIWRSRTTAKSAVATEPPTWRTMFMTVEALGISAWERSK